MRKVRMTLMMLGLTALAVGVMLVLPSLAANALPTEHSASVRLTSVATGAVEQMVALAGRIRYEGEYVALAPVTALVKEVYVRAGDSVSAGQALFRLDASTQEATLSAVYAAQETASASADLLVPGTALETLASLSQVQQARAALNAMTVRASVDGQVLQVNVTPNSGVMAGTAAMLLSTPRQEIRCTAVLHDAEKVQIGQQARILSGGITACTAIVREVGAARTDERTGQTVADVTLAPSHNLSLPLGAAVETEIVLAARSGVSTLPLSAITDSGTVWWAADGRLWETPAHVQLKDELYAWVSLPDGIRVVDTPASLTSGQRYREVNP